MATKRDKNHTEKFEENSDGSSLIGCPGVLSLKKKSITGSTTSNFSASHKNGLMESKKTETPIKKRPFFRQPIKTQIPERKQIRAPTLFYDFPKKTYSPLLHAESFDEKILPLSDTFDATHSLSIHRVSFPGSEPVVPVVGGALDPVIILKKGLDNTLWDEDDSSPKNPLREPNKKGRLRYRWSRGTEKIVCTFHPYRTAVIQCVETQRCYCSTRCYERGWIDLKNYYKNETPILENPSKQSYGVPCKKYRSISEEEYPGDRLHYERLYRLSDGNKEEQWTLVSNDKVYIPRTEDIGRRLKLEVFLLPDSSLHSNTKDFPHQRKLKLQQHSGSDIEDYQSFPPLAGETAKLSEQPPNPLNSQSSDYENLADLLPKSHYSHLITGVCIDLPTIEKPIKLLKLETLDPSVGPEYVPAQKGKVSLLSWNCLADMYATENYFEGTEPYTLTWTYRKNFIIKEILQYESDVICLQEVQDEHFFEFFLPKMNEAGFDAVYKAKTRPIFSGKSGKKKGKYVTDGCATFYRRDKLRLLDSLAVEFKTMVKELGHSLFPREIKDNPGWLKKAMKDNVGIIIAFEILDAEAKPQDLGHTMNIDPRHQNYSTTFHQNDVNISQGSGYTFEYSQNLNYGRDMDFQPMQVDHHGLFMPSFHQATETHSRISEMEPSISNAHAIHSHQQHYEFHQERELRRFESVFRHHHHSSHHHSAPPHKQYLHGAPDPNEYSYNAYENGEYSYYNHHIPIPASRLIPVSGYPTYEERIVEVERPVTGPVALVTNTHILANPSASDVKLWQTYILLTIMEEYLEEMKHNSSWPPQPPDVGANSTNPRRTAKAPTLRKKVDTDEIEHNEDKDPPDAFYAVTSGPNIVLNVLAGDFNSPPGSSVYEFISTGRTEGLPENGVRDDPIIEKIDLRHKRPMFSTSSGVGAWSEGLDIVEDFRNRVITEAKKKAEEKIVEEEADGTKRETYLDKMKSWEPSFTIPTKTFTGCLDYIFYDPVHCNLNTVNELPTAATLAEEARRLRRTQQFLPSPIRPSDHLPLYSVFEFEAPTANDNGSVNF